MANGSVITQVLEQRRNDISRIQQMQGRNFSIFGTIPQITKGEALARVAFPVRFVELPNFGFGGELIEGYVLKNGQFPTVSVVVAEWHFQETSTKVRLYQGATLAIVVSETEAMRIHWRFEGAALSNPLVQTPV